MKRGLVFVIALLIFGGAMAGLARGRSPATPRVPALPRVPRVLDVIDQIEREMVVADGAFIKVTRTHHVTKLEAALLEATLSDSELWVKPTRGMLMRSP